MSKKQKKDKAARSTRQLMGIEEIKDYCIATRMGNLVFFIIKPTNISVLPDSSISARIYALLNVVKGQAEIEMLALNSKESFERNKDFYRERLSQEELPAVRRLLEQDSKHLDRIQVLMASSREFYIIIRLRGEQESDVFSYIHFTEEQKQRAAAVDLEEFLRCRGEKMLSSGREKRLASDHSVTVRGNEWYDHAEERGGHAVSFVQRFYGLSYPDAVTMLLGSELGTAYPSAEERTEEPAKPFVLPPANKDMRRVFAYLIKHRGIARDVVAHFAKAGLLYEDAEYHNAVFVGTDVEGVPRHAHKRSANSYGKAFRLNVEGSDPRYSFHYVGTGRSLYVFEAPIDMLSFITLYPENWQRHSYVACCGTSIQPVLQMLEQAPQLGTILLCLDNDEAGHQASRRMQNQLEVRYSVERLIPENKDWNDDLTLNSENAQGLAMNEMR